MRLASPSTRPRLASTLLGIALLAGACSTSAAQSAEQAGTEGSTPEVTIAGASSAPVGDLVEVSTGVGFFDSGFVHAIEIAFDQDDYSEMIVTYETSGEKDWIEATVTVDGTTFENVGIRLKGNSSLFSLSSATAGNPEDLPWLISLDKYEDGQNYEGIHDIVIRSNSTETSLNEAVALDLLGLTGLATQDAVATTFTVNGGETELRLAIEHPDEVWQADNFDSADAALYKADSEGDYSYRGTDEDAYDDVFNQKVGEDDLEPLMAFLDFINNSDDATFAAELDAWLDVDAFATYLAFQDLIQNADDIDGRGNNSYLHYDYDTEQFTVVSWDLNLAFGTANVGGGGPGAGGARPEPPQGAGGPAGPGGLGAGGDNVLASRFLADHGFSAMYDQAVVQLTDSLFTSGAADTIVARWVDLLSGEAGELVATTTIASDAAAVSATFPSA